jgi:peptide/nickel transport system substrate-binding protein
MLAFVLGSVAAQVLVTAIPVNPTSLDPHRAIEGYSFMVTNQIYDTLVRLDDDGRIAPALAVAWSRPAPNVLRLELRPGVRFHDGRPLDAEAVAASLRRLIDPATGARGAFLLVAVDRVEVVDAHTLDLVTRAPFVPLLANLTFPATAIVPPGAGEELGRAPVGTGPFRFVAWRDGDEVELVADPDYWGGAPALAGVRYRVMPERATQSIAFRAGDVQLIHDLSPDAFVALEGQPGVELVRYPSDRTSYLEFNLGTPAWATCGCGGRSRMPSTWSCSSRPSSAGWPCRPAGRSRP